MPQIELSKLSPIQLKSFLTNCQNLGQREMADGIIQEMHRRGIATKAHYRTLAWNQDRVDETMKPFRAVAESVRGNRRTAYTRAGGLRIGRPKNDPDHLWVDSYSAIKTLSVNAVFECCIKAPGNEPEFRFWINGGVTQSYNADRLTDALDEWRTIAAFAVT